MLLATAFLINAAARFRPIGDSSPGTKAKNGEGLVNKFLKGFVGAAALIGAAASTANAQDYTWSVELDWFRNAERIGGNYTNLGFEKEGTDATGSFTLTRTGASTFTMSSWNISTSAGTLGGTLPTLFANTYVSGGDGYSPASTYNTGVEFYNEDGDFRLSLTWFPAELVNAMNDEIQGSVIELRPSLSVETEFPALNGTFRRTNGTCELFDVDNGDCEAPRQGWLTLTNITPIEQPPTATPEPASMALLGAGLLGLFAARRRRAV
jgi:hypothetical protein